MDLPPMFPYKKRNDEYFEDGGVVDNLPVRFGLDVEACDFLFVIPLNSDFEQDVNTTSIISRLYRVMSVRQGALERNALQMVDFYNALVRSRGEKYDWLYGEGFEGGGKPSKPKKKGKARNEKKTGDGYDDPWYEDNWGDDWGDEKEQEFKTPTRVFAVCPRRPLIIDTPEFWKTSESREAFQLMYETTRDLLAEKDPLKDDPFQEMEEDNVVLHLVSRFKDVSEDHNI